MVVILPGAGPDGSEIIRPASTTEIELWSALTRRFATPVRESYVRVNEQDLVGVLLERDHLRKQVADLQRDKLELSSALEQERLKKSLD